MIDTTKYFFNDEAETIESFYQCFDEYIAGDAQYVVTEEEIEQRWDDYLECFGDDDDIYTRDEFGDSWVYVDSDIIAKNKDWVQHNLQNELDRNGKNAFHGDKRIIKFVQSELAKYE